MQFGIHNLSWKYGPDPAEAFEKTKTKAQWAENHGFVWFSVMDHLIQIGGSIKDATVIVGNAQREFAERLLSPRILLKNSSNCRYHP